MTPGTAEQLKEDARKALRATMTAREGAAYIGLSYWKALEMVKAGQLPHIRIGGRVLFRRQALDAWLEQQEQASVRRDPESAERGKIRRLK
jgi:excisionase family DNA binding protein